MKRYSVYAEEDDDYDVVTVQVESDNGEWVLHSEAQAEIDRLKAENAELKTRFGELLQQEFRGHQLQDRMMFTVKGREIVEWWVALDKSAIAKARGDL